VILPSRSFQKPSILALGPLSARTPAHHVDIKQLCEMRLVWPWHDMFYDEDFAVARRGRAAEIRKNFNAFLIAPVMEDHLETVRVGWRKEHVAADIRTTVLHAELACLQVIWVIEDFRQIQDKTG
jgi:hypothetical protein